MRNVLLFTPIECNAKWHDNEGKEKSIFSMASFQTAYISFLHCIKLYVCVSIMYFMQWIDVKWTLKRWFHIIKRLLWWNNNYITATKCISFFNLDVNLIAVCWPRNIQRLTHFFFYCKFETKPNDYVIVWRGSSSQIMIESV